jgi:hypothetical protein
MVHPRFDRTTEYCQRTIPVLWRTEHTRTRELHGAKTHPADRSATQ